MGDGSVASSSQRKKAINQKLENAIFAETRDNSIGTLHRLVLSFFLLSLIFLVVNFILRSVADSTIEENLSGLIYTSDLNFEIT